MSTEPTVVARGRNVYGVHVGIVMVDTDLPRPLGDIGDARTFDFPVVYGIATGAGTDAMVSAASSDVTAAFAGSARELHRLGVSAVATSCGLLARDQQRLVAELPVPVATSSLLFASLILRILPADSDLGILTIDSEALLGGGHFDGIGLTDEERRRIRVAGLEGAEHFHHAIMGGGAELDTSVATGEVVEVAERLLAERPGVGALLLECTNLAPYAEALRRATGLPVWDATSLVRWLQGGYRTT
jgi:hypothetical protein